MSADASTVAQQNTPTPIRLEVAPVGLVVMRCPHCNGVIDEIAPVCGAAVRRKCSRCSQGPGPGRPAREVWVTLYIPPLSVLGRVVDDARAEIERMQAPGRQ